jgi:hypothetical protein
MGINLPNSTLPSPTQLLLFLFTSAHNTQHSPRPPTGSCTP